MQNDGSSVVTVAILAVTFILIVLIAFLPSIIAFKKEHPNRWLILAINGFLGPIGGIGWLLALVWSLRAVHKSPLSATGEGSDGGESGLNLFVNDERKIRVVGGGITVAEELSTLKDLLDSGAISQDEFASLKTNVLSKIKKLES